MPSGRSAQLFYTGRAPVWRVMTRITWMMYVAYSSINSAVPNLAEESISELQFVVKRWKPYLPNIAGVAKFASSFQFRPSGPRPILELPVGSTIITPTLSNVYSLSHYHSFLYWALIVHKNLRWLRVGQSRLCNHEEEELFLQHFAIDQGHFRVASVAGSVDHDLFKKLFQIRRLRRNELPVMSCEASELWTKLFASCD